MEAESCGQEVCPTSSRPIRWWALLAGQSSCLVLLSLSVARWYGMCTSLVVGSGEMLWPCTALHSMDPGLLLSSHLESGTQKSGWRTLLRLRAQAVPDAQGVQGWGQCSAN